MYFPDTVGMTKEQLEHFVPKKAIVGFDPELKPFLLFLKNNYTSYQLVYVLAMKTKYAIRLYEILKSYLYIGEYQPTISELRALLQIVGYDMYSDFRKRVLNPAVEEINRFTDIEITATPIRAGKTIDKIQFKITLKDYAAGEVSEAERDCVLEG